LGEPFFETQVVFDGEGNVREPYLAIAVDGTLLAVRNNKKHLRRSEDGGQSWEEIIDVPITHSDSNMIVDENTGDIMSVRMWNGTDRVFRSTDNGKTWTEEEITVKPTMVEGSEHGDFDGTYHWQVDVKRMDLLPARIETDFKPPVELFQVKVHVLWKSGTKERSTVLETYRTIKLEEEEKTG